MVEIARLTKMPELAKRIETFKPQPDPMRQQLQQLEMQKVQMEIEKMKADIADKYARAGENEVDRMVKMAKAKTEEAKARKLHSDADRTDLDFLKTDEDYGNELEGNQYMQDEANHQRAMEMETLKAKLAELQREHDKDMQDRQQAHEYGMVKLNQIAKGQKEWE